MDLDNETFKDIYVRNLSVVEANALREIKQNFGISTNVGTIKKCLVEYVKLKADNMKLKDEVRKIIKENNDFKQQLGAICEGFDAIKKFKKNNPNY